jgi:hypothetical protein
VLGFLFLSIYLFQLDSTVSIEKAIVVSAKIYPIQAMKA